MANLPPRLYWKTLWSGRWFEGLHVIMPSPFPGMDPYLEGPEWTDFHTTFLVTLREELHRLLSPRYVVRVDRRVYLEPQEGDATFQASAAVPGVLIDEGSQTPLPVRTGTAVLAQPHSGLLPQVVEVRETFLEIRELESRRVVTAVETLSPTNKRPGSEGREHYLAKRQSILQSPTHLVEIDLLRGGRRPPLRTPYPAGDYFVLVSRAPLRPKVDIYGWALRDPMPAVPIPLLPGDSDAQLDLQSVFTTTYDRSGYEAMLQPYRKRPLEPALAAPDQAWIADLLKDRLPQS